MVLDTAVSSWTDPHPFLCTLIFVGSPASGFPPCFVPRLNVPQGGYCTRHLRVLLLLGLPQCCSSVRIATSMQEHPRVTAWHLGHFSNIFYSCTLIFTGISHQTHRTLCTLLLGKYFKYMNKWREKYDKYSCTPMASLSQYFATFVSSLKKKLVGKRYRHS